MDAVDRLLMLYAIDDIESKQMRTGHAGSHRLCTCVCINPSRCGDVTNLIYSGLVSNSQHVEDLFVSNDGGIGMRMLITVPHHGCHDILDGMHVF